MVILRNTTPHSKMAARTHRKGFTPLPSEGWSPEWGTWEDYVERCVHESACLEIDIWGDLIEWLVKGQPHREDGPAKEYSDGYKSWYVNGRLHRLDGPARISADGSVAFYKDGIWYTDITFTQRVINE